MVMEWVLPVLLVLGVLIVAVPVGVYFGAVGLLWASSLFSGSSALSRVGFYCPFRKQRVTADFVTGAGEERPSDVLSCLGLAETHAVSTALLPRYSLIAGGTAYREAVRGRGD
jgi:hypothetical protein